MRCHNGENVFKFSLLGKIRVYFLFSRFVSLVDEYPFGALGPGTPSDAPAEKQIKMMDFRINNLK